MTIPAGPGKTYILDQARAPHVPVLRVMRGQQRSLQSPIAEYPQVSNLLVKAMIAARSSKLGFCQDRDGRAHRDKYPRRFGSLVVIRVAVIPPLGHGLEHCLLVVLDGRQLGIEGVRVRIERFG